MENMKWEKNETESDFICLEEGNEVEGIYVGKEQGVRYPNTFDYKIDIEGQGTIKKIGGSVLTSHFEKMEIGTPVKIVYKGQKTNKNGVKYHDYEVYKGQKNT